MLVLELVLLVLVLALEFPCAVHQPQSHLLLNNRNHGNNHSSSSSVEGRKPSSPALLPDGTAIAHLRLHLLLRCHPKQLRRDGDAQHRRLYPRQQPAVSITSESISHCRLRRD